MTNKERWLAYTDGASSPQNYIDWTWRFVIAASLQRRVAFNGDPKHGHMPLFPNMYLILVGRAGVGKGIIINPAIDLLRHWKKKDIISTSGRIQTEGEKLLLAQIDKANQEAADDAQVRARSKAAEKVDPPWLPYAPDATTFEALVDSMGGSIRRINITELDASGNPKLGVYTHCSMYFSLPELGSLLRKRTEDTVNYLLGLYDNPPNYEYKTKTKGEDRVRHGCLNILAGTTPEFMETIFDQNLIDQGFSSRTFFIFANKNRKNVCLPPPLTSQQLEHKKVILEHIKKLTTLYGEVTISKESREWLEVWWNEYNEELFKKSDTNSKLAPFDARMNIHVLKVAMAEHFSESTELFLPHERLLEAVEILKNERKSMALALTFQGKNPIGKLTDLIIEHLRSVKKDTSLNLIHKFWKDLPNGQKSVEEVLQYLIQSNQIEQDVQTNELTGKNTTYYCIKE